MKKGKMHRKAAMNETKPVAEEATEEVAQEAPAEVAETEEPVAEEPKEEAAEVAQEAPQEEAEAQEPVAEEAKEEPTEEPKEEPTEEPKEEAEAPQEETEEPKEEPAEEAEEPKEEPAEEAETEVAVEDPYEGLSAEELKEQLIAAVAEAADMKRRLYSTAAEYDNYRKRTANTRVRAYADGRADVVSKLFPIADNLSRALQSCAEEKTAQGIQMVVKAFEKVLEEEHITVIDPLGEPFDAETCEAIMAIEPVEGEESGVVKDVYLKGYEQNGKILRFAQVVVTK